MKWQHETNVIACHFVLPSCRRLVHMACKYTCVASLYAHVVIPCHVGMGFTACMASQITSFTDITQQMHNYLCCVLLYFLSILCSNLAVRSCLLLQCILLAPH